ncbi:ABC transporter ATP-binding protein [Bacillus sp. 03113]|uniref:ABC transporter ATP-binding protein n=1 Tax=Bacillus sp. 03113 TaxID=2578211 RepID=UPI001143FEBA|nr:ABC transporter ATP-binding protein [Bacillus sp. 03113]
MEKKHSLVKTDVSILLEQIEKSYGDTKILSDVSIHVKQGELVTILGPSGCGKSTIFNLISGLQKADDGILQVKEAIGYMQQKDLLLPWKNIIDNIVLPLDLQGRNKKESRDRALALMDKVGLSGYENKYPAELSGGMRQRANFLRTFISSQKILLLDEPFGALDSITKGKMQRWLLDIKEAFDITILFITHDIEEAILLSDRIYVLSTKPAKIKKEFKVDFFQKNKKQRFTSEKMLYLKNEILLLL